ncbi:hypothetical protein A6E01_17545 [Vibrio breoganii]|uniref:Glycosyltransferase family 4 protein n=1 Tax=Vibrio breoganii TaxID=553239 RepID=A0AAN0XYJ9_9VIBR|nr:glycosyltransferase family 4 protein [Vibrio breoganii]ANO34979.1 hypothetical protein A6E01_17545 [Vibrio breoganii]
MKFCFVCNEYPPFVNGGIGTFTKEIAESLVREGHSVTVVGFYNNLKEDAFEVINGVELQMLKKPFQSYLLARTRLLYKIKKLHDQKVFDILECQDNSGLITFLPKLDCKIIVRFHGSITYFNDEMKQRSFKDYAWKFLEAKTIAKADQLVSVSDYTAERTRALFSIPQRRSIYTIYNGVVVDKDLVERDYTENSSFNVVFSGSILRKKGFFSLINSWDSFNSEYPGAVLHIAGKDNQGVLERILERNGLIKGLKYHGILDKNSLNELYDKCDIAVFPSFSEAFALAPMEAMARRLPVIYSKLSSGKELIPEHKYGYLIDPNFPEQITTCLREYKALSISEKKKIANNSYDLIKNKFDVSALTKVNIEMYNKVIYGEN